MISLILTLLLFFFTVTATTEIYTLSLHDALPILSLYKEGDANTVHVSKAIQSTLNQLQQAKIIPAEYQVKPIYDQARSEEHTSELQSRPHLVCRLLLEKKKKKTTTEANTT